jgi:hypothetical protein
MATRDELIAVVAERYARSTRKDRGRILDEFGALTGLHRKHAMRLLRGGTRGERSGRRPSGGGCMTTRYARRWSCSGRRRIGYAASGCGR